MILPPLTFAESPNRSGRRGAPVRLIVLHRMQGSFAGGVAWLRNPASQASAHLAFDPHSLEAVQLVRYSAKAWHAGAANGFSEGVEVGGTIGDPLSERALWTLARIVAFRLHRHGLPARPRYRGDAWTLPGFCRHSDLGAAGGHPADTCMTGLEWSRFVPRVKAELVRGGLFRAEWGLE